MVSQYQITKTRKELKRLQGQLAAAQQKHADTVAAGARGSAELTEARVCDLQASVDQLVEWLAANARTKFDGWSPGRLQRHAARHDQ